MPVYFGSNKTTPIYKGTTKIDSIYKGLNLVYKSSLLPSGYIECEYLESTGTQYINTGLTINQNSKIVSDLAITRFTGNNYYMGTRLPNVFGCSNTGNGLSRFAINVNGTFDTYINVSTNTKYNIMIDLKNKNATSNGSTIPLPNYTTFSSENLFIFAYNGSGTATAYSYMRYYNFVVYDNDTLVQYLVPCLDNNGVPCMYDLVGKQAYYNQGEGEFLYKVVDSTLLYQQTMLGFPSSNSTSITTNSTFPYSYYFNDITLEYGKKYKMTFSHKRTPSNNDDGTPRFRLINTDNTFYVSLAPTNVDDYWNVESITYDGNWFGCEEIIFSPKVKTHKLRLLIIVGPNQTYPPNFYLTSIEEVKE